MSADHALTLIRQLLGVTIFAAGPLLAASLIAGVLVGIVQTATQINEASIGFAVKTSFVLLVSAPCGTRHLPSRSQLYARDAPIGRRSGPVMLEALVVGYALRFALITCRIAGFIAASPFPGDSIPLTARVGLLVVLSAVSALAIGAPEALPVLGLTLAVRSVAELGLGVLIGFAFYVLFAAADILGGILAHGIGFAMPSLLNPAFGNTDTAIGNLVSSFSMLLVLSMGLHRTAIGYLLESFRAVPPGHLVPLADAMPLFIELVGTSIVAAARLAMPVVAVSITSQVALAMLSRASPSLQIFSIGFTLLILAGLSTLAASLQEIAVGLMQHVGTLPTTLDRLLELLAGA